MLELRKDLERHADRLSFKYARQDGKRLLDARCPALAGVRSLRIPER